MMSVFTFCFLCRSITAHFYGHASERNLQASALINLIIHLIWHMRKLSLRKKLWQPWAWCQKREFVFMLNICEHERGWSILCCSQASVSNLTRWGACQASPQIPQRFSCVSWMQPSHHVPNTIFTCSAKYHRHRSPVRERNTSAIKVCSTKSCAVGISDLWVNSFYMALM